MTGFGNALVQVLAHPFSMAAMLVTAGVGGYSFWRHRRLRAIRATLRDIPPGQRRYILERQHKLFPGASNKPLEFIAVAARKYLATGILVTVIGLGTILGLAIHESQVAAAVSLRLDPPLIAPHRYGYLWMTRIHNDSSHPVNIKDVSLEILREEPNSKQAAERWAYPETGEPDWPRLEIQPGTPVATETAANASIEPGASHTVRLCVLSGHDPERGITYEARLTLRWSVAGHPVEQTARGETFRLSWPGVPHWSRGLVAVDAGAPPVVEPAESVDASGREDPVAEVPPGLKPAPRVLADH